MDLVERVSRTATDLRQHDWRTDVEHGAMFGAVACGGLIMFFAPMKVSRTWRDQPENDGFIWTVGAADWSAWVFLGAFLALVALAGAGFAGMTGMALLERLRSWAALLPTAIFAAVALFSGDYWRDLQYEKRHPIDFGVYSTNYVISGDEASGFVAVLAAVGAMTCLALAGLWRRHD
ncbi:MAG: hypothetical protein ACRDJ9_01600 [Dehalococcoidia bacterium]